MKTSKSDPAATTPTAEAKLQALGAPPAKKEDPLATAKANFQAALEKTKADSIDSGDAEPDEKIEIIEQPKKVKAKAAPAPAVKDEPPSELEELRKQVAELRAAKAKPEPEKVEAKTSDYDTIKARLKEEFGDEEGDVLGDALHSLLKPREERLDRIEKMLNKAIEKSRVTSAKDNRTRLKESYAQLKSEEAWEVVKDRVESIFAKDPDKYDTQADAYNAVAKAIYGEPDAEADANEEAELAASRIAASLPTPPKTARSEAKVTSNQRSRAIFDHLLKNPDDLAGAKRVSRKLQVEE